MTPDAPEPEDNLTVLGKIMLANHSAAELALAYSITVEPGNQDHVRDVGEQALLWGDIELDGTLT